MINHTYLTIAYIRR